MLLLKLKGIGEKKRSDKNHDDHSHEGRGRSMPHMARISRNGCDRKTPKGQKSTGRRTR